MIVRLGSATNGWPADACAIYNLVISLLTSPGVNRAETMRAIHGHRKGLFSQVHKMKPCMISRYVKVDEQLLLVSDMFRVNTTIHLSRWTTFFPLSADDQGNTTGVPANHLDRLGDFRRAIDRWLWKFLERDVIIWVSDVARVYNEGVDRSLNRKTPTPRRRMQFEADWFMRLHGQLTPVPIVPIDEIALSMWDRNSGRSWDIILRDARLSEDWSEAYGVVITVHHASFAGAAYCWAVQAVNRIPKAFS